MTEKLDSIQHVYIFHYESGVCLYYHAFTDSKIDPQLVAGFISAITSIGGKNEDAKAKKKGAATKKASGLKELVYKEYRILMEDRGSYKFAILITGEAHDAVRSKVSGFINHFMEKYDKALKGWKGGKVDVLPFKDAGTMIVSDLS
jgi:hypothetical protein